MKKFLFLALLILIPSLVTPQTKPLTADEIEFRDLLNAALPPVFKTMDEGLNKKCLFVNLKSDTALNGALGVCFNRTFYIAIYDKKSNPEFHK